MTAWLFAAAVLLAAGSGVPGLLGPAGRAAGQRVATLLMLLSSGCGMLLAIQVLVTHETFTARIPWHVPGGEIALVVDALAAMFLLPVFLIAGLGALYGEAYWTEREHPESGRRLRLMYGIATAGLATVMAAGNGLMLLASWEVTSLAAYFLVTAEDRDGAARDAGWVYLVATHTATLVLFALFALLHGVVGDYAIVDLPAGLAATRTGSAIFLLALLGFGFKAGIMPLHVWLPGAHAAAPSHVSALMSGVVIKMGVYGIARIVSLFPDPPLWWGGLVLVLGVISGVLGVAFALGQHDLKRLLAYHSIENIGIILMGLGLGLAGVASDRPSWIVLGYAGGLLHVWNHGLFKALLFFGAGAVVHGCGTREMDLLGGLAKRMPKAALLFLVGAVAICGLPPLNGFVSEIIIYLGLFATLLPGEAPFLPALLAVPALAFVGALALACFVKAFGVVFLGAPRSAAADHAHEPGTEMLAAGGVLALACVAIGLFPALVGLPLDGAVRALAPDGAPLPAVSGLAPLHLLSYAGGALVLLMLGLALVLHWRSSRAPAGRTVTWDCGYAAPTARMQYTASSMARDIVAMFGWALWPVERTPRIVEPFPPPTAFDSHVPETVLDRIALPLVSGVGRIFAVARYAQRGRMNVYLLYTVVALVVLLLIP